MNSFIFWPLWTVLCFVAMAAWVYGELGTIGYGYPYAPWVWLVSLPMAIGTGIIGAQRLVLHH